jgi:hypothetical protein
VLGLGWTSPVAFLIYVGGVAGALLAIFALWEKIRPVLWPRHPDVMLGHPGAMTSQQRDDATGERRLVSMEPSYLIENKDERSIYDVTTGFRTRDGQEHVLDGFRAQILEGKTTQRVEHAGQVPESLLAGLPPEAQADEFLYWARFQDGDRREWEVVYDPSSRTTEYRRLH